MEFSTHYIAEVSAILSESKKKDGEMRQACEDAIEAVNYLKDGRAKNILITSREVTENVALVMPFVHASKSKNIKLLEKSLVGLNILLTHKVFSRKTITQALTILQSTSHSQEEVVLLKVLQLCLGLLTSSSTSLISVIYESILGICFHLSASKTRSVSVTAQATVKQIILMLFERCDDRITSQLLREIVMLAEGKRVERYGDLPGFPRKFTFEIIDIVTRSYHNRVVTSTSHLLVYQNDVIPLLTKRIVTKDFAQFQVVVRLSLDIFTYFCEIMTTECEVLLVMIVNIVNGEYNDVWQRAMVFEFLRSLLEDEEVVAVVFRLFDLDPNRSNVVSSLVEILCGILKKFLGKGTSLPIIVAATDRVSLLDAAAGEEPPALNAVLVYSYAFECISVLISSLREMSRKPSFTYIDQLVASVWENIRNAFVDILLSEDKENDTEILLNSYLALTDVCIAYGMLNAKSDLVNSLCSLALAREKQDGRMKAFSDAFSGGPLFTADVNMNLLNVIAFKMLIRLVNASHDGIGDSWDAIIYSFNILDILIAEKRGDAMLVAELNHLSVALDASIGASSSMSEDTVRDILSALQGLVSRLVRLGERKLTPKEKTRWDMQLMFALSKISQISTVNVARIHSFWPLLEEHFKTLSIVKGNERLRREAILSFFKVMTLVFSQEKEYLKNIGEKDESSLFYGAVEGMILSTLLKIMEADVADVIQHSMLELATFLQMYGSALGESWSYVFSILDSVSGKKNASAVSKGFECLRLTCNDFLYELPSVAHFKELMRLISQYSLQKVDVNVSLSSGNLFWNIFDFISSETTSKEPKVTKTGLELKEVWVEAFGYLYSLSLDPRSEVRNCAVHNLFRSISSNGKIIPSEVWVVFLNEIHIPMLQSILNSETAASDSRIESKIAVTNGGEVDMLIHHSRNTGTKQWDETVVFAVTGTAHNLCEFYSIFAVIPEFNVVKYWKSLLRVFKDLCASHSLEVAENSIKALAVIMGVLDKPSSDSDGIGIEMEMWSLGFQVFRDISSIFASDGAQVREKRPVLFLMTCVLDLYREVHKAGQDASIELSVIDILHNFTAIAYEQSHTKMIIDIFNLVKGEEDGGLKQESFVRVLDLLETLSSNPSVVQADLYEELVSFIQSSLEKGEYTAKFQLEISERMITHMIKLLQSAETYEMVSQILTSLLIYSKVIHRSDGKITDSRFWEENSNGLSSFLFENPTWLRSVDISGSQRAKITAQVSDILPYFCPMIHDRKALEMFTNDVLVRGCSEFPVSSFLPPLTGIRQGNPSTVECKHSISNCCLSTLAKIATTSSFASIKFADFVMEAFLEYVSLRVKWKTYPLPETYKRRILDLLTHVESLDPDSGFLGLRPELKEWGSFDYKEGKV